MVMVYDPEIEKMIKRFARRHPGEENAELRARFRERARRLTERGIYHYRPPAPEEARKRRTERHFRALAAEAGLAPADWRNSKGRGDVVDLRVIDYVLYPDSARSPYLDAGKQGLALVEASRTRYYASTWGPSTAVELYLVGRTETGAAFAHRVSRNCLTIRGAVHWIWGGKDPVERKGDVAIVRGRNGRPPELPEGHTFWQKTLPDGKSAVLGVTHPTHGLLRPLRRGEKYVAARRAAPSGRGVFDERGD